MKPNVDASYLHFDETGSIPAIKYARITLGMGLPILAARNEKEVAVAVVNRGGNTLLASPEKRIQVSKHATVLVTGHGGDTNQLRQLLRDLAVQHKFVFGSEISPKEVALSLSDYLHELGMSYRRPLGVGIIVAGFDVHGTKPAIYHCDVDGNAIDCFGIALGREATLMEKAITDGLKEGANLEKVLQKAAEDAVKSMKESNPDMASMEFRVDVSKL